MKHSDGIKELAAALVKAQADMKNPPLDSMNPHFKSRFASLAGVRDTVMPTLAKHGLTVSQFLGNQDGGITCETVMIHSSGEWVSECLYMPATKADAQGYGSAITYARRYALMAICGVVGDEDDDATAASKPAEKKSTITPTTGLWEALDDKTRSRLTDMAVVVKEYIADGDFEGAVTSLADAGLDTDQKAAIWTQFDSKARSGMKRATQELAIKAGMLAEQA